ncbi:MAG: heparinase II/III family protein [Candidatus Eisenbacteria bacterium]|nr:heparinase II/III family protein [Candidatus Eisenbacteria bacterium]
MNPFLLPRRAYGRIRRRFEARRHTAADEQLLLRADLHLGIDAAARAKLIERFEADGPWPRSSPLGALLALCLTRVDPGDPALRTAAADAAAGRLELFGQTTPLVHAADWSFDYLRGASWPMRPHAEIRLDQPDRPGDVRVVWERARFHHALLVAAVYGAAPRAEPCAQLEAQWDQFLAANPPYSGVHWAVGMEVAIRAAAWILTLAAAPGFGRESLPRWIDALLLHGLFLETHLERHPHGFTTNHTLSDHAGLAVLGRAFADQECGRRWLERAHAGLVECLAEQVLRGGAHSEGSLPYARFVLETALVTAAALDAVDTFSAPLEALAQNLARATINGRLPAIGDGDESFFPPFTLLPFERRDPCDPGAALAAWRALRGTGAATEAPPHPASSQAPAVGAGFLRLSGGRFEAIVVARHAEEGFVPTHGHNDLLSICLDFDRIPFLIDPGTGGYGWDRALRHLLRSTTAHSTLQVGEKEQRALRPRAIFEGPPAPPGGARFDREDRSAITAWHDGFDPLRHERRVRLRRGLLLVSDRVVPVRPNEATGMVVGTVRWQFAVGARVEILSPRVARVSIADRSLLVLLLHPRGAGWQSAERPVSPRYGRRAGAPVLEARIEGALPLRSRVAFVDHQSSTRWRVNQEA